MCEAPMSDRDRAVAGSQRVGRGLGRQNFPEVLNVVLLRTEAGSTEDAEKMRDIVNGAESPGD
jgi:hypothetical protein